MMEGLVTACCLLLSLAGVTSGTLCLSNVNCPQGQLWCIQDCSAVAIEEFNLTASDGSCKISSTDDDTTYGCHFGACTTELCTPSIGADTDETNCCCTGDFCNTNFSAPPTMPTGYHIYPSFPSHITSDQLVCEYHNCTNETNCVRGYEVCDENPLTDYAYGTFVCVAVFYRTANEMEVLYKGCFNDADSSHNETCVLEEFSEDYYTCECNRTLCNNNGSMIVPSNHSFTAPPTGTAEPVPTSTDIVAKEGHVYPTYPQHTTLGQLVCDYYNCTDNGIHCVRGYEVCNENPLYVGDLCAAAFNRTGSELKALTKGCFMKSDGATFHNTCVLTEYPPGIYSCLCDTTLCNANASLIAPPSLIDVSTSTDLPKGPASTAVTSTVKTTSSSVTSTIKSTSSSNDNNKPNYTPLIYGITAGICLLIILTVIVIVTLAYCRTKTSRHLQSVSYNKLINS